jgi:hypothetical protein
LELDRLRLAGGHRDRHPRGQGGGIYFGAGTINLNSVWIGSNTADRGDGMYWVTGATVNIGYPGVTWYDDQVLEEP